MGWLCRECLAIGSAAGGSPCAACGSDLVVEHAELKALSISHIDCDSFYASVEKRDDPALRDVPVLVGGAKRGVVMAACYVARRYGVHSAMPMFQALKACPDAVVVRPDMEKYGVVGRQVRALMRDVTPLVEPISIDEAFLDLAGTERLHGGIPARTLAALARRIEMQIGITVSIGLSYNKFLAKLASGLSKPRGFAVIGEEEAVDFLRDQPVERLWGVGRVMTSCLAADGIRRIGQLRDIPEEELVRRYGSLGARLSRFSRGRDTRRVQAGSGRKSLSAETTFADDLSGLDALKHRLWPLCEKVSRRLKTEGLGGGCVTLKLKTASFRLLTRAITLPNPTVLAEVIYGAALALLEKEADGTRFRLIGVGLSHFTDIAEADPLDLANPDTARLRAVEEAVDDIRAKFGDRAIVKGRRLERREGRPTKPYS